jgi:hypothetical protein
MASVLAKIQSLEREKLAMAATLESNNARSPPSRVFPVDKTQPLGPH